MSVTYSFECHYYFDEWLKKTKAGLYVWIDRLQAMIFITLY